MGAPQYEQAGADIGGTGTTNTIPRWTGPSTLGDSGFVDDGSTIAAASRMLAIGTSSTTGARVVIQNNSSGNTLAIISLSVTGSAFGQLIDAGTNASDYALNIRQRNTGTPLVYVRGDGNVGIGTASPGYKCVVADTVAGVVTSEVRNDSTNSAATARLRFTTQGGESWIEAFRNAGGALTFATLSTERARIDSSGNLILNTANTGATIQAAGTSQGLKLPATPGNADTQTLDCYQENPLATTAGNGWTPTLSAAATWGGTQPTVDYARYIRIGSLVFCEVRLSGAALTSTIGSTTISMPPATINSFATESTVQVCATGANNGVGICNSTTVFLPTLGSSSLIRLSWFYFTTS